MRKDILFEKWRGVLSSEAGEKANIEKLKKVVILEPIMFQKATKRELKRSKEFLNNVRS